MIQFPELPIPRDILSLFPAAKNGLFCTAFHPERESNGIRSLLVTELSVDRFFLKMMIVQEIQEIFFLYPMFLPGYFPIRRKDSCSHVSIQGYYNPLLIIL